jgi:DNA-binding NarL/FixJ family response regulator
MKTEILLIGYHQRILADALSAVFNNIKDFALAGVVPIGDELLDKIRVYESDILVLEFDSLSFLNLNYIKKIRQLNHNLKILILSDIVSRSLLEKWLPEIDGYMLKSCSAEEFIFAIRKVSASEKFLCSRVATSLFKQEQHSFDNIFLTEREREILVLMLLMENNRRIANKLNISESTVRTHRKNIRHKFGAANQIQLLRYACRERLLPDHAYPICPNCRIHCVATPV